MLCFRTRKPVYWYTGSVKTTVELPADLVREIKIRAAKQDRRLKDVMADLLRRGLSQEVEPQERTRRRVRLPLVRTTRAARPEDMAPERLDAILLDQETPVATER